MDSKEIENAAGHRLVGARAADHSDETPFLVAINKKGLIYSECTGMLVSPVHVISAAHCTQYMKRGTQEIDNSMCVESTAAGKEFHRNGFELKCKRIETDEDQERGGGKLQNIEITPVSPKGKVWLGVDDMNNIKKHNGEYVRNIKKVIRHGHSYQGGSGYGTYGGYDITMIVLEKPLSKVWLGHFEKKICKQKTQKAFFMV